MRRECRGSFNRAVIKSRSVQRGSAPLTQCRPCVLQRDAMVGHAQAIRNESWKPPKAHTHNKHQANNTMRAADGFPPARHPYMHLTRTPLTQQSAPCATKAPPTDKVAPHPPKAPTGTRAGHTQREPRRRGNPLAPVNKPRHRSAGAPGQDEQNKTNRLRDVPNPDHNHTHTRTWG